MGAFYFPMPQAVLENPIIDPIQIILAYQGIYIKILDDAFQNSELLIYNILGQPLIAAKLNSKSNYIPIESRDQLLILRIQSGKRSYSEKLMLR